MCVFVVIWFLLTGSCDVSRNTGQGSSTGAGHTLVPPQGQIGQRGDEEAAGPQHHTEVSIQQLLAVMSPADVGRGRASAAAQVHTAPQLLHHRHGLLSEERVLI